jgi:hypothetical protein
MVEWYYSVVSCLLYMEVLILVYILLTNKWLFGHSVYFIKVYSFNFKHFSRMDTMVKVKVKLFPCMTN